MFYPEGGRGSKSLIQQTVPSTLKLAMPQDRLSNVGIGAQQDSLRSARAIASKLGVHRSLVRASVLGEHGDWMVPMWSSVYLTVDDSESASRLEGLKAEYSHVDM